MIPPDTPTAPNSVLAMLRRFHERGTAMAKRPRLSVGNLQLWADGGVRPHLERIYGKGAQQLTHFPRVPKDLPETLAQKTLRQRLEQLLRIIKALDALPKVTETPTGGSRIFIGHGRSPLWRELKDFIADRLHLPCDEFNREAVAGYTTSERLDAMMAQAAFAFLVMTAEEERIDATAHARPNVIHEVGLFQGRLGLHRAIVMLEDGCAEFSNIAGLSQIRFPRGGISAKFEEVRQVLEREGLV